MSDNLPNRKKRREIAKAAGLLNKKSKMTFEQQMEITRRSMEVGKHIHRRNVEDQLRQQESTQLLKETELLQEDESLKSSDDLRALTGALKKLEEQNGNLDN